jgi:DNA polymerase-3 subunit gamma/tau
MARAEGVTAEEDALALMARYAFGSMRDGQSLFEQAAVSGAGNVTAAMVEGMLGLVGTEAAIDLAAAAILEGAGPALNGFSALRSRGADLKYLYLSLIDVLRDATVLSFTGREDLLFRYSPTSLERVRDFSSRRTREEWMFLLDIAFRSERDVLGTEFPHLGFELLLLRLANAQGLLSLSALEAGETPALPLRESSPPHSSPPPTVSHRAASQAALPSPAAPDAKPPAEGRNAAGPGLWDALKRAVEGRKGKGVILMGLLNQMQGGVQGEELVISCPNEMFLARLKEADKWSLLLAALEEAAGRPVPVRLAGSTEKKSPEPDAVGSSDEALERRALSDPVVLEALRAFEGSMLVKVQPAPAGKQASPEGASPPGGEAPKPPEGGDGEGREEGEEASFVEAPAEEEER